MNKHLDQNQNFMQLGSFYLTENLVIFQEEYLRFAY